MDLRYQADGTPVAVLEDVGDGELLVGTFASVSSVAESTLTREPPAPAADAATSVTGTSPVVEDGVQVGRTSGSDAADLEAAKEALGVLQAIGVGNTNAAGVVVTQTDVDAATQTVAELQAAIDADAAELADGDVVADPPPDPAAAAAAAEPGAATT